jgi:hypothetical protein
VRLGDDEDSHPSKKENPARGLGPIRRGAGGGEGGIRTHGTPFGRTADFESAPL